MFLNKVGVRRTGQIAAITSMLGAGASGCATQAARVTEHAIPTAARGAEVAQKTISHAAENELMARRSGHFTEDTFKLAEVADNKELFWGTLVDEALAHEACAENAAVTCKSLTAEACEGKELKECGENVVCGMTLTSSCSDSVNSRWKLLLRRIIPRKFWDRIE